MMSRGPITAIYLGMLAACGSSHGHGHAHGLDDPSRDAWQHPDEVMSALAPTPAMTVADVGAGTGYFTMRLARAVPAGQVIATDLDAQTVHHLEEHAQREHLANVRAVVATRTSSGLAPDSVDAILMVHVWHHLDDKAAYARDLAAALRPGGKMIVVEFAADATRGPPAAMRVAPERLVADLEAVGLHARVLPIAIPEQYLVEARRE